MKRGLRISRARLQALTLVLIVVTMILPDILAVHAADGDLDTSFSSDGYATLNGAQFFDVAIQTDGKILAAGVAASPEGAGPAVARFNTDGSLDASFGNGGVSIILGSDPEQVLGFALAVILQGNKILLAGATGAPGQCGGDFLILRLNQNGSLDSTFGTGGVTSVNINNGDIASSIAFQGNKIIVGGGSGITQQAESCTLPTHYALVRFDSNGGLDTTFGVGGIVERPGVFGRIGNIVVLADGRIVMLGEANLNAGFDLLSFLSDGAVDSNFCGDSHSVATFGVVTLAGEIALTADGKIVAAGYAFAGGNNFVEAVARFDSNGCLDTSFNGTGKVLGTFAAESLRISSVAVQGDGRIIVAGVGDVDPTSGFDPRFVLSRWNANGSLDTSFGVNGNVTAVPPPNSNPLFFGGLALQADGKIVGAGELIGLDFSPFAGIVARFNGSGGAPSNFDICVESSQNSKLIFKFNSTTGAYEFHDCSKGYVLTGTGTLSTVSCKLYLNDTGSKPSDRTVAVIVNTCTRAATVSVAIKSPAKTYGFTDNDITQGTCSCP